MPEKFPRPAIDAKPEIQPPPPDDQYDRYMRVKIPDGPPERR
jgi:hypothetical protein